MRLEVNIPDSVYNRSLKLAEANGVPMDGVITAALRGMLEESGDQEPVELSPEQAKKVQQGLDDVAAGRVYTLDQVREHFRRRYDEAGN